MGKAFVALTILTMHEHFVRKLLSEEFQIDTTEESVDQDTKLTTFGFFDCGTDPDFEHLLLDNKIPYSLRVEPSLDEEGKFEHFRVMPDRTTVSTGYTDSMKGRMVSLDELIIARQAGIRAVDDLIQQKHREYPVISWSEQFDILMLPPH